MDGALGLMKACITVFCGISPAKYHGIMLSFVLGVDSKVPITYIGRCYSHGSKNVSDYFSCCTYSQRLTRNIYYFFRTMNITSTKYIQLLSLLYFIQNNEYIPISNHCIPTIDLVQESNFDIKYLDAFDERNDSYIASKETLYVIKEKEYIFDTSGMDPNCFRKLIFPFYNDYDIYNDKKQDIEWVIDYQKSIISISDIGCSMPIKIVENGSKYYFKIDLKAEKRKKIFTYCYLTHFQFVGCWWPHIFYPYRHHLSYTDPSKTKKFRLDNNVQEQRHGVLRAQLKKFRFSNLNLYSDFIVFIIKIIANDLDSIPGIAAASNHKNVSKNINKMLKLMNDNEIEQNDNNNNNFNVQSKYKKKRYENRLITTDEQTVAIKLKDLLKKWSKMLGFKLRASDVLYNINKNENIDIDMKQLQRMLQQQSWTDTKKTIIALFEWIKMAQKLNKKALEGVFRPQ